MGNEYASRDMNEGEIVPGPDDKDYDFGDIGGWGTDWSTDYNVQSIVMSNDYDAGYGQDAIIVNDPTSVNGYDEDENNSSYVEDPDLVDFDGNEGYTDYDFNTLAVDDTHQDTDYDFNELCKIKRDESGTNWDLNIEAENDWDSLYDEDLDFCSL